MLWAVLLFIFIFVFLIFFSLWNSYKSFLAFLVEALDYAFSLLYADIDDIESILDQLILNDLINLCITLKTGRMINLQKVWFTMLIKYNIKAKKLKAHPHLSFLGPTRLKVMSQIWLYCQHGLYYYLIYLFC